jgi:soluble lytic murein transglycosylase-like protein
MDLSASVLRERRPLIWIVGFLPTVLGMSLYTHALQSPRALPPMNVPGQSTMSKLLKASSWDASAAPYEEVFQKVGEETGLDPKLLKAVAAAESQFQTYTISRAGACGIMQLMPQTAKILAVDNIFDPEQNIRGGALHLKHLMKRFSHNLVLAVAAYNAGEQPVLRYKGIPPYEETQHYVRKVMQFYNTPLS